MSLYQAKHKARGRYGVIDDQGQWLVGFLGNQTEALNKANELNQALSLVAGKTHKLTPTYNRRLQHFILTTEGWLSKGE